jgi:hypothetical protein
LQHRDELSRLRKGFNGECREGSYGLQPVNKHGEIMRPSGHEGENVNAGDESPAYPETKMVPPASKQFSTQMIGKDVPQGLKALIDAACRRHG